MSSNGIEEVRFDDHALDLARDFRPTETITPVLIETGAFTVSSIVAGGKGTICGILDERGYSDVSKSHTTRDPEPRDGANPENPNTYPTAYHFVETMHMAGKILAGEMLEVAPVHGNIYGTSLQALRDVAALGRRPLLEIDIQGVQKLKAVAPELPSFFITPTTVPGWLGRWAARDKDISEENFVKRVTSAQKECTAAIEMAYLGDMMLIANVDADVAADSIIAALDKDGGIVANQETRLLELRDFNDALADDFEDGHLWESFQLLTKASS